jgi:hypothetical protein
VLTAIGNVTVQLKSTNTWSAHRRCRIDLQNATGGQIVEQLRDGGQVLFDRRLAGSGAELFDVSGDRNGFDIR